MALKVLTNPDCEISFWQIASGEFQHVDHAIGVRCHQFKPVQCKKKFNSDKCSALVAINKRMVA